MTLGLSEKVIVVAALAALERLKLLLPALFKQLLRACCV
jgi:hypothetical protein